MSKSLVLIVAAGMLILVLFVFYLITLQRALSRCSPQNRILSPRHVWLTLIPIFGLGWEFVVVVSLAKSLHAEFAFRNMAKEANPGMGVGLAMCTLQLVGVALRSAPGSLALGIVLILLGVAGFVCWIAYWLKIAGFSGKIAQPYQPTTPPARIVA